MKFKKRIAFFTAIMMALLTVGCGSKSMSASEDSATMESVYGTDYSENEYCEEPAETADAGVTSGNGLEAQVENGRKLIRTVSLSLQTKEFDSVLNSLKTKTTELGGYVENSSISGNSYSYTTTRYASYTIRIPADKLNEFVDIVGELGNVTQENESVEDVTLQYVDVESHKKALETEQARLMELLSTAENMEDLLAIESKLSDIRYEIESYESQLRLLDNQIDYSTVHVEIFEVERMTDAGEKGFFEEIKERFGDNLYKVGHGFRNLIIGILGALPILIVCAVGCFLIFMVSPKQAILFIIVFLILQQIEGNLIYPHVVGGSVGLPSIWVLAAVTIGGNLMGIVGMLIFIPLVSVLYTIFREFVYLRLKEKNIKQVTKTVVEEYTAEEIAAMEKNIKKNRE